MADQPLKNYRIAIVEDEYLLADELVTALGDAGAIVLGPVGTTEEALDLIESHDQIDAAVLDANLHGEMAFVVADALQSRNVSFMFLTGYDHSMFPPRFADVVRCEKPANMARVVRQLCGLLT